GARPAGDSDEGHWAPGWPKERRGPGWGGGARPSAPETVLHRGGPFPVGVGPLAHLLKNRFYIGEVRYRGEVYRGEHEPILSRDVFEAVQAKLAANAVDRRGPRGGLRALSTHTSFS